MNIIDYGERAKNLSDEDREVGLATAVAYSSKEQRSLIVAGKIIDRVIEPLMDGSPSSMVQDVRIAEELESVYKTFPEAFAHVHSAVGVRSEAQLTGRHLFNALPFIANHEGLPLACDGYNSYKRITPEDLEKDAQTREAIAAALYNAPPSKDFLRDHDLGRLIYSDDPVLDVYILLDSIGGYEERAAGIEDNSKRDKKYLEESPITPENIQHVLSQIRYEMSNADDEEYTKEVENALNDGSTTIKEIMDLLFRGRDLQAKKYREIGQKKKEAYEAIMSGEAATYVSSKN